jgi:SAM-dependent methyltransferase
MNETVATTYDEIPYESNPHYPTHPDCLAVAGRLRGMSTASPRQCRVLELGCATGGNLIPMAYQLPESHFVGIDLSETQIAMGQQLCRKVGLKNIELRTLSILDADESLGKFDYIICHGVYSWVPRPVQDHILWVCRHLLAPQGVAYVSYNTYPGWHQRAVARELMRFYAARFDDPQTKIKQARNILGFMSEATAKCKGALAPLLDEECKDLRGDPGHYLFHEHLEEVNAPLYFYEFMSRAAKEQLQYLGEAWFFTPFHELPPELFDSLKAISTSTVELEQFVDFLKNKKFRRTLLCHAEIEVARTAGPEVMHTCHYSALAEPVAQAPDVASPAPEKFRLETGPIATMNYPVLKAALVILFESWPQTFSFDDLFARAADRAELSTESRPENRELLAALLRDSYLAQLVAVHTRPGGFTTQVSKRPRASALARLLASESQAAPNLRQQAIELEPMERSVLLLADGTRTLAEIAQLAVEENPSLWDRQGNSSETPLQRVERSLSHLAQVAFLEA